MLSSIYRDLNYLRKISDGTVDNAIVPQEEVVSNEQKSTQGNLRTAHSQVLPTESYHAQECKWTIFVQETTHNIHLPCS